MLKKIPVQTACCLRAREKVSGYAAHMGVAPQSLEHVSDKPSVTKW